MILCTCPVCNGVRLRSEILLVTVVGYIIVQVVVLLVEGVLRWATEFLATDNQQSSNEPDLLPTPNNSPIILSKREHMITTPILDEIRARLTFLMEVGLKYLTMDRAATTL